MMLPRHCSLGRIFLLVALLVLTGLLLWLVVPENAPIEDIYNRIHPGMSRREVETMMSPYKKVHWEWAESSIPMVNWSDGRKEVRVHFNTDRSDALVTDKVIEDDYRAKQPWSDKLKTWLRELGF